MIRMLHAIRECTEVWFRDRKFTFITAPRRFWSDLTKAWVYGHALRALSDRLLERQTMPCNSTLSPDYLRLDVGKALASGAGDAVQKYFKTRHSSHEPLNITMKTRAISNNSYPYRDQHVVFWSHPSGPQSALLKDVPERERNQRIAVSLLRRLKRCFA